MRHTHLSLAARCALNRGERGANIFVHHTLVAPPPLQFGQITSLSYKQGFAFIDYADQRDAQVPYRQPELLKTRSPRPPVCVGVRENIAGRNPPACAPSLPLIAECRHDYALPRLLSPRPLPSA